MTKKPTKKELAKITQAIQDDLKDENGNLIPASNVRYGDSPEMLQWRKQAEQEMGGPVFLVIENGEAIAYPQGKQAATPNVSTKRRKPATQPVHASQEVSQPTYIPPTTTRLTNYVKSYAFDLAHGTSELDHYRAAIRKAKQARLRAELGLVEE